MANLSTPPLYKAVNSTGQVIMSVGVLVAMVAIVIAAVRLARRWSTPVPVLLAVSTLWAGFMEPIYTVTANLWYYKPGQVNLFTAFGTTIPVWVLFSYCAFYGGFGLVAWWLVEKGTPRRQIVNFALYMWVFAILTEVIAINLGTYRYWGPAPFRVAGFPLWISLGNVAVCTTIGVAAARLRRLLPGKKSLAMLFLGPASVAAGLVGAGFPVMVVMHTAHPATWLLYLAAMAALLMEGTMVWLATQLVPVEGMPPIKARTGELSARARLAERAPVSLP
jgi:hypothetical protein